MKYNITIKSKLIGSFIISFLVLAFVFISFVMPHFREKMIEEFKHNAINNIKTIDEKADYILKAELENLTFADISSLNSNEIIELLHNYLIFSKNDIYQLKLGSFNILINDIQINIDEKGEIRINQIIKEMKKENIIDIIDAGGLKTIKINNEDYHIFAVKGNNDEILYYRMVNCDRLLAHDYEKIEPIVNIGIIFIFSFSLLLLIIIHKIVILPIRKLNRVTTKIVEDGNMNIQVDINCRDEIGKTADSFNKMVRKIKNNQENLESIVEERTKKLVEAKKEADKASQAKSDFLANMSHEIRTPINAVIGLNDLLLRTELSFKQKDYASKISKAANNLLNIINDILDFSKVEAGKMIIESIEFDLNDVIDEIAGIIGIKAADQGIEFVIKIDNDVPSVLIGDPKRLTQVLLNFINNAVKFTHEGEVLLEIFSVDNNDENIELCFRIKDTGIGMNEETLNSLFEKFTQADTTTTRVYGGTGLGMAITQKIVELMNGKIKVDSELNKGTIFEFNLQFGKGEIKTRKVINDLEDIDLESVIIIDDNEDQLLSFREYLNPVFSKIYTVDSGIKAIEALKVNHYDLMIVDYKMKPINGFETIGKIIKSKEIVKPNKIILTTAYGREIINKNFSEYKIDDILMKPVLKDTLFKSIKSIFTTNNNSYKIDEKIKKYNGKILVAEDNEINQMVVVENLENKGFDVDVANNGKEAIEKAKKYHYDVILMDLQMPIYSGYEASVEIKETINKEVPIIALSADVFPDVEDKVRNSGMVGYISKPIDFEKLFNMIIKYSKIKLDIEPKHNSKNEKEFIIEALESFDVLEGIERMNGNINSYFKVLKRFKSNSCKLMKEIKKEVDNENINGVLSKLHQLKGTAGNLGLNKGYILAKNIEEDLKKSGDLTKVNFDSLYNIIKKSSLEIDEIEIIKNNKEVSSSKDLKEKLKKIEEMVKNYDIEAIEKVIELEDDFENIKKSIEYNELLNMVNNYDYEKALNIIEKIINNI